MKKTKPKEENSEGYPITVEFEKVGDSKSFASREDITLWLKEEQSLWHKVGANINTLNPNDRIFNEFLSRIDENNLSQRLIAFSKDYFPAQSLYGFYETIGGDRSFFNKFYSEFTTPEALRFTPNDQIYAAKILALFARSYGMPLNLAESSKILHKEASLASAESKKSATTLTKAIDATTRNLEILKKTFVTDLALKAPTKFWQDRAKLHKISAEKYRRIWKLSLGLLISFFVFLFAYFGAHKFELTPAEIVALARNFLLIASIISLSVWFSRTTLRDVRSHEHLAIDAEERVTMIRTYSALKEAGLEGADLSNVLAALYRPVSTGLIEENGPSLPMEIILKQISKLPDNQ